MHDARHARTTERPTLGEAAAAAGFRRVDLVRLTLRGDRTFAEATGVMHRCPHTVPISLATAGRLLAAGARLRVVSRTQ